MLVGISLKRQLSEFRERLNTLHNHQLFPWPDVGFSLRIAPYANCEATQTSMMAWFEVQEAVNKRVRENVTCQMIYSAEHGRARLQFVPTNLLGALWLQFARAVDGGREDRICANAKCRRWIEPSENGRSTRRYCNDACRRTAHEGRRQEMSISVDKNGKDRVVQKTGQRVKRFGVGSAEGAR
jgi:hypothetical protein